MARADLGEAFDPASLVRPELPPPDVADGHLRAPAIGIDRFGNVQLLAGRHDLAAAGFTRGDRIWAAVGDRRHPATVGRVFADAAHKGMPCESMCTSIPLCAASANTRATVAGWRRSDTAAQIRSPRVNPVAARSALRASNWTLPKRSIATAVARR